MKVELTLEQISLLVEALTRGASRHESEARYNPRNAKPHADKANAMRKLQVVLSRIGATQPDAA